MLDKLKKFFKDNKFILIVLTVIIGIVFSLFFFGKREYVLTQDQLVQYELFYEEWIRLVKGFIKTGNFPFYSWNSFLGADFFTSKTYYLTGDIFLPIHLLSPFSIRTTLMICTILLIYISAISFNYFLKEFGLKKETSRTIISILYALSGIATLYFSNFMFHRFYALLPLLLLGVERYIQYRKKTLFIIMVTILFFQSYYFMFPTSIFLIFYYLFSVSWKEKYSKIWQSILSAIPLIGAYFIGLLMSLVIILPTIFMMLEHPRVGATEGMSLFWDLRVVLGFVFSHITSPFNLISNSIPYAFVDGYSGHAFWYSVYAGVLVVISCIQFLLFNPDKRKKRIVLIGYFVLFAFIFIQPLNSIMHGFSEPSFRWIYLYIIYNCLIAALTIDNDFYLKKRIWISYGIYTILFLIALLIGMNRKIIEFPLHNIHVTVSFLFLLLGWIYVFMLINGENKFVYSLTFVEVTATVFAFCFILSEPYHFQKDAITKEYVQYYQSVDEDIGYRMYINHKYFILGTNLNLNESLHYQYKSLSTYDSTYEVNLDQFLKANGFASHVIEITDPVLLKMLGVKYYIVENETELPETEQFEYVYDLDHLHVYKLVDYNHIGFTYSSFSEGIQKEMDWLNTLAVDEELYQLVQSILPSERIQFIVESQTTNTLEGKITTTQDTMLFFSIPYNRGWNIYDNGVKVYYYKVQGGFIGIPISAGEHSITMRFIPYGFKTGAVLTIVGGALFIVNLLYEKRNNKKISK